MTAQNDYYDEKAEVLRRLCGPDFNMNYGIAADRKQVFTNHDLDEWLRWKAAKPDRTHSLMLGMMKKYASPSQMPRETTYWQEFSQKSRWSEAKCREVGETLADYWSKYAKPKTLALCMDKLSKWPSDSVLEVLHDIKTNQDTQYAPGIHVFLEALRARHSAPVKAAAPEVKGDGITFEQYKQGVADGRYENAALAQCLKFQRDRRHGLGKAWGMVMDGRQERGPF